MATIFKTKEGRWKAVIRSKDVARHLGKASISSTFKTKALAQKWARRMEGSIEEMKAEGRRRAETFTVGELINAYMEHYTGKDDTRGAQLKWWHDHFKGRFAVEITPEDIHRAITVLEKEPVKRGTRAGGVVFLKRKKSGATLNRYLSAISAVFSWACNPGNRHNLEYRLEVNPCSRIVAGKESPPRDVPLNEEEQRRLLIACKASEWSPLYTLVTFALTTGARKGELLGLKWQDVDLEAGTFVRKHGQTKETQAKGIPLPSPVVELLKALRREQGVLDGEAWVFPDPSIRGRNAYRYMVRPWQKALRAARLEDRTFHDLRHTCAVNLARQGYPLDAIGNLLGHRQPTTTARYMHYSLEMKRAMVEKGFDRTLAPILESLDD